MREKIFLKGKRGGKRSRKREGGREEKEARRREGERLGWAWE